MRISPYIRIMRAAMSGRGVVLSPEECIDLSMDDAISTCATNIRFRDGGPEDERGPPEGFDWGTDRWTPPKDRRK